MFIGVDHGTQAVRFATLDKRKLELPRENITESSVVRDIEEGLNLKLEFVKLIGLTYSMGDGITKITNSKKVRNRGSRLLAELDVTSEEARPSMMQFISQIRLRSYYQESTTNQTSIFE